MDPHNHPSKSLRAPPPGLRRVLPALLFCAAALAAGTGRGDDWPPREWRAFGPLPPFAADGPGTPDPDAVIAASDLRAVPEVLAMAGRPFTGTTVVVERRCLDLAARFGAGERGRLVCLAAPVVAERAETRRLGASADWFMRWWLNGEPLYDTLRTGNRSSRFEITDHVFDVPLRAGPNVLAAAVISGSGGFRLVVGDPGPLETARAAQAQRRYPEALEAWRRVASAGDAPLDERFEAWLQAGACLLELGRPREALEAYDHIPALPDAPRYYHTRARLEQAAACARMGDTNRALALYGEVQAMPGPGIPLRHRSLARHEARRLNGPAATPDAGEPAPPAGPAP